MSHSPSSPPPLSPLFSGQWDAVIATLSEVVDLEATARQFQAAGLAIRPFRPLVPYDIAIFHSAEQDLSLIGRTFLEAFDAHLQGLIAPATETDQ